MDLIADVEQWNNLKLRLPSRYNIETGKVLGAPNEFPCMLECFPVLDNNGYNIRTIFFYKADAVRLLKLLIPENPFEDEIADPVADI